MEFTAASMDLGKIITNLYERPRKITDAMIGWRLVMRDVSNLEYLDSSLVCEEMMDYVANHGKLEDFKRSEVLFIHQQYWTPERIIILIKRDWKMISHIPMEKITRDHVEMIDWQDPCEKSQAAIENFLMTLLDDQFSDEYHPFLLRRDLITPELISVVETRYPNKMHLLTQKLSG
jgi:hypothetical protein